MARDSRCRRRTRIAAGTCTGDGEPPTRTSSHDLPDFLLELALLRVRTPVCLFRAGATCKLWRRVIAGDDLLRVRSLHRPNHLLGHYSVNTTWERGISHTVVEFVPFPARPAVHLRQRLSLDFLIDGEYKNRWPVLTDSRGGLLAFVLHDNWYAVVCDPWTRQCTLLGFPWGRPGDRMCLYDCLGALILDAGDDGDDKSSLMSSFSVLCVCLIRDKMDDTTTAEACVFSARDNGWIRWTVSRDVCTNVADVDMDQRFVGRAGGYIFFSGIETIDTGHVLLVLDEATGDFSTITLPLPPDDVYNYDLAGDREKLRVVIGGAGTLVRIVRLVNDDDLEVVKVTRTHGGWECTVERSVDLCQVANIESSRVDRSWRFLDTTTTAAATLVLGAFSPSSTLLFSLDVQTMKLRRANKTTTTLNANGDYRVFRFPYQLPWPQKIN